MHICLDAEEICNRNAFGFFLLGGTSRDAPETGMMRLTYSCVIIIKPVSEDYFEHHRRWQSEEDVRRVDRAQRAQSGGMNAVLTWPAVI